MSRKLIIWMANGSSKTLENVSPEEAKKAVKAWEKGEVIQIRYGNTPPHLWGTDNLKNITGFSYEEPQ